MPVNLLQRPEILGSIIGGAVALAIACSQLVAGIVDRHQIRKALLRDIRHALYSFRIALFPAADRGMADPEKWAAIVARINDLHTPKNTRYLRDLEAGAPGTGGPRFPALCLLSRNRYDRARVRNVYISRAVHAGRFDEPMSVRIPRDT